MREVEVLYPEFGNQSGDNGNAVYLRACLEGEADVRLTGTSYLDEPAFAMRDVSMVMLNSMTEAHQELAAERLRPHRDRLAELADAGVPMLFTHSAAELLGRSFQTPDGREVEGLGLFDFDVRLEMPRRFLGGVLGSFRASEGADPIDIVGCKIQFTQIEGDNSSDYFCTLSRGFGLREGSSLEGFRRNNLIATWILGPLLPTNPDLARWMLGLALGRDPRLAYEEVARAAFAERLREHSVTLPPGTKLGC